MPVTVRPATEADLPQIQQIFEYYVLNTVVSFLVQKPPSDYIASRYRDSIGRGLPYLVAVDGYGGVLGYSYASAFRGHMLGYGHTVEISLFCHPDHTNKGIGSRMIKQLIDELRTTKHISREVGHERNPVEFDVRKVFAVMAVDENAPDHGLALRDWYKRWGFEEVGRLKGVGFKKGRTYSWPSEWKIPMLTQEAGLTPYISSWTCSNAANNPCSSLRNPNIRKLTSNSAFSTTRETHSGIPPCPSRSYQCSSNVVLGIAKDVVKLITVSGAGETIQGLCSSCNPRAVRPHFAFKGIEVSWEMRRDTRRPT